MSQVQKRKSPCYCIGLRRAANAVSEIYDGFLKPVGLSVNQFSLVVNLSRLECGSVSDLANYVGLERTTVVRALKPLMARGLIEDVSMPGRRERALRLTRQGEKLLAEGLPLWETAQAEIERRLGGDKTKELYDILGQLYGQ